jgi:hypothetical protein
MLNVNEKIRLERLRPHSRRAIVTRLASEDVAFSTIKMVCSGFVLVVGERQPQLNCVMDRK